MRHVYWIINDELCARPGPNEIAWNAQELFDGGIRAVLSVNKGDAVNAKELARLGINYKRVPLPVTTPPKAKDVKACLKKLSKAYAYAREQIADGRPVLVHCRHGNDRTGLFLAYFLARRYAMTADAAIEEIRSRRAASLSAYGWQRFTRELIIQATPASKLTKSIYETSE